MIRIQFEMSGPDFEKLPTAGINAGRRAGAKAAAEAFAKRYAETRFEGEQGRDLDWARRTQRTERIKAKVRPGTQGKPHLFTGRARRRARGGGLQLRTSNRGFVLKVTGLHEGYGRRVKVQRRNRQELAKTSRKEVYVMGEIYASGMKKGLNEWMAKNRRKLRVDG